MRTRFVAALGTVLVVAYASLACLDLLVLNSLARIPGRSLAEISADVTAAGNSMDAWMVIAPAVVASLVAVSVLLLVVRHPGVPARIAVTPYALLLVAGAPVYFFAGFGPGIGMADTYAVGGGPVTPWHLGLYAVSLAALVGLLAMLAASARRRPVPQLAG